MGALDNGTWPGGDRPVAMVSCAPTPLAAALVVALTERGFEVHVPRDVLGHAGFDDDVAQEVLLRGWRQVRVVDAASRTPQGRAELLMSVARSGRPLSVAVLALGAVDGSGQVWPDAATIAALALMSTCRSGGRLLLVPAPTAGSPSRAGHVLRSMAPDVTVTTLDPAGPRRPHGSAERGAPQDALEQARTGVDALMTVGRRGRARRPWWPLVHPTA